MVFCDEKKAIEFACNPGSPLHVVYKPSVKKDGEILLEEAGVENTDEMIEAAADSCDIHHVIARYRGGDINALNVRDGMYGDFTEMPKTYAEMLQLQINAKEAFYAMSPDVRRKFDDDVNKFLASAGSDEWIEKLTPVQPDEKDVKEGVAE